MRVPHYHLVRGFLGAAAILALGCSDSMGPPTPITGTIVVTVSTVGGVIDEETPTGYGLSIDGGHLLTVGANDTLIIGGVSKGNRFIRLDGLAPNCSVAGTNPRNVVVSPGGVALRVSFNVVCVATVAGGDPSPWDY